MREILFRGKRKDNSEWVYGSLLQEENRSFIGNYINKIMYSNRVCFGGRASGKETNKWKTFGLVEVIPETIGQYTGLNDKNGKKIFEGDIVFYSDFTSVYKDDITGVVKYTQDCMFEIEYDDKYSKNRKTTRPLVCHEHPVFAGKKTKVIGNIYEKEV